MASQGDPRVLVVMNAVLSGVFATVIVWGLSFIDLTTFGWRSVGALFVALFALTYLVTMRD